METTHHPELSLSMAVFKIGPMLYNIPAYVLIKESAVLANVLRPNGTLEHTSDDNPFDLSSFGPGICQEDFELFIKFVYLSEDTVNTLRDGASVLKLCQIFEMKETRLRAQRRLDEILADEDRSELDPPLVTLDTMIASCQGCRAKAVGPVDQDWQDLETDVDESEKYSKLLESYKATLDKRQSLMDRLSEVVMKHEQDKQLLQSQVDASTNSLMAVIGERDQLRMKWDVARSLVGGRFLQAKEYCSAIGTTTTFFVGEVFWTDGVEHCYGMPGQSEVLYHVAKNPRGSFPYFAHLEALAMMFDYLA